MTKIAISQTLAAATHAPTPRTKDPRYNGFRVYRYGPLTSSSRLFSMQPAAQRRRPIPSRATENPTAASAGVGRLNKTNKAPNKKPRGTRIFWASARKSPFISLDGGSDQAFHGSRTSKAKGCKAKVAGRSSKVESRRSKVAGQRSLSNLSAVSCSSLAVSKKK